MATVVLALLLMIFGAQAANAQVFAVECHGCSATAMSTKAGQTTNNGSVYVFNKVSKNVKKYRVFTEMIDTQPMTWWTQVFPKTVESALSSAYTDWVEASNSLESGPVPLPPGFPIATAAGAESNIGSFLGHTQNWLSSGGALGFIDRFELMREQWEASNLPWSNFGSMTAPPKLALEFSDGSSIEVVLTTQYDVNEDKWELTVQSIQPGSARDADGNVLPSDTSGLGWTGFSISGPRSILDEWLSRARGAGIPIVGPGTTPAQGTFTCEVVGSTVTCELRQGS